MSLRGPAVPGYHPGERIELVTAAEMRRIDRRAIDEYGLTVPVLMEQVGYVVASEAARMLGGRPGAGRVLVLAGPGNNGGDGLVAARYLRGWGYDARVLLIGSPERLRGAAAENWRRLATHGVPASAIEEVQAGMARDAAWDAARDAARDAALLIDALVGTGARLPLDGALGRAAAAAGEVAERRREEGSPIQVLAVDIPSGIDPDTGSVAGPCIAADVTVTMCRPKLGILLYPAARYCGEIVLAPIPIPDAAVRAEAPRAALLTAAAVAAWLPPRPPDGHKGTFGHVLVIGGAPGYAGAPAMAAMGALRAGAGLVTLVAPAEIVPILNSKLTEVMVRPGPPSRELLQTADVIVAGPGLGCDPATGKALREALTGADCPLVLDADGLNILDLETIASYAGPVVLTPHPGEMARLLDSTTAAVQADRPASGRMVMERLAAADAAARACAERACAERAHAQRVCVLKGARTLIVDGDGFVHVNPTGNDGMATAGAGDVLAGVIGGLLAQGAGAVQAACCGAYVHGLAGDIYVEAYSRRSLVAGDLLDHLGDAFHRVER